MIISKKFRDHLDTGGDVRGRGGNAFNGPMEIFRDTVGVNDGRPENDFLTGGGDTLRSSEEDNWIPDGGVTCRGPPVDLRPPLLRT